MKKALVILVHAFVIWVLCGMTMGIGMVVTSQDNTLMAHAVAAPIIASIVSMIYFKKFNYTAPLQTAVTFVAFVILVDFFIVSLLIVRSLEMFRSILGTWIPFVLIFVATYLTGTYVRKRA
jgi:hydrogenase-4 membrane subunit HyfE